MAKVLTIDTKLGEAKNQDQTDPLMLTTVTGIEGISQPFAYDVSLARHPSKGDVVPQDLIGTMARIGIQQTNSSIFFYRTGMIQNFQKAGVYTGADGRGAASTNLLTYRARIVPAFQMLAQETRFRIFAQQDAVSIIQSIFKEMNKRMPVFLFNMDRLIVEQQLPVMEYCVQFGESTYAFLSRLMDRFGIWYTFDHDVKHDKDPKEKLALEMQAENETLFLGRSPIVPDKQCFTHSHTVTTADPKDDLNFDVIASFQRQINAKMEKVWAGNFNILNPIHPVTAVQEIHPAFDTLVEESALATFLESEEFPGRFQNDSFAEEVDVSRDGDKSAKLYVGVAEDQQEEDVYSVSGATKNASLFAGRKIDIFAQNQKFTGDEGEYLLKYITFSAYEHSYLTTSGQDVLNFIFRDFLLSWLQKSVDKADLTMAIANAGLNNYLQNEQALMWSKIIYGDDHIPSPSWILPFSLGGITQVGITTALSTIELDVKKVIDANAGDYSNTFVAIPRGATKEIFRIPSPEPAGRPIAHGPHSAVVIGPDGVDTSKKGDIYADRLGRVRIRFPWDPGPPKSGQNLPPEWTSKFPGKPYETGDNTCFVRVTEEWAGRHYGTQFLPRIGQEVLVSFIDGDPERPVITGRLYNADHGTTNIPFPDPDQKDKHISHLSDLFNTASSNLPLSGIKTWSIPTTDSGGKPLPDRYNLLRFNDKRDTEQYLIRAQHRLDITALDKRYESISSDRHLTVGGIDQKTHTIGGNYIAKVFKDYNLHVGDPQFPFQSGNRKTKLEATESLSVGQNSDESIGGNWAVSVGGGPTVGGQVSVSALLGTGVISMSALTNITLMCGASILVMTPAGVSITAPVINLVGPVLGPSPMMGPSPVPLPPIPAIPAMPQSPQDPTAADPGDKLTPPKE